MTNVAEEVEPLGRTVTVYGNDGKVRGGFLRSVVTALFCLAFCSFSLSQDLEDRPGIVDSLRLGEYWQVTSAIHQMPQETNDLSSWRVGEPTGDLDKWYKPDDFGKVDPTYGLVLLAADSVGPKPFTQYVVKGRLVMPSGKVFAFEKGVYDVRSMVLKFTTARRDGLIFDGEAQFLARPKVVEKSCSNGQLKLLASSEKGGFTSVEFPIKHRDQRCRRV